MAERTRRRRGGAPEPEPRRRRRGGAAPEPSRRRRRGGEDAGGDAGGQEPAQAPESTTEAASADENRSTTVTTEVTLPQLGESVTEGTITAWLVEVGDTVEADQPLFELSSDKIDTEVPAPTGGVLKEIKVEVDETVDVGTVVAIIGDADEDGGGDEGGSDADADADATEDTGAQDEGEGGGDAEAAGSTEEREDIAEEEDASTAQEEGEGEGDGPESAEGRGADYEGGEKPSPDAGPSGGGEADGDGEGVLASPIVRRMLAEADIDPSQVEGTGEGGRITREDAEKAVSSGGGKGDGEQKSAAKESGEKARSGKAQQAPQPERRTPLKAGDRERVEDLSRIRQRIAAKMMESMQSSAQLTTVQEADMTRVMRLREEHKDAFKQREGVSLSPFVFLARAAVLAVRNHPHVNAQADWDAAKVKFHDYVNLGIAVDTEKGLLVPNVKGADDLTISGLARAITDVANKARGKGRLEMQDIEGGTFTITNTGSRGVLLDTPILNYPEVAILATGAVKKRPVVVDDEAGPAIAIRDMVYLCLTYDHRLIDGADAARFVSEVAEVVETHDWAGELGY